MDLLLKGSSVSLKFWGTMDDTVEKSCWSVTLWAVVLVVGAALVVSYVVGGDAGANIEVSATQ